MMGAGSVMSSAAGPGITGAFNRVTGAQPLTGGVTAQPVQIKTVREDEIPTFEEYKQGYLTEKTPFGKPTFGTPTDEELLEMYNQIYGPKITQAGELATQTRVSQLESKRKKAYRGFTNPLGVSGFGFSAFNRALGGQ